MQNIWIIKFNREMKEKTEPGKTVWVDLITLLHKQHTLLFEIFRGRDHINNPLNEEDNMKWMKTD
jgi:hypothetical protein